MQDSIDAAFTEFYNEAQALYDADDLEGCISKARELLDDTAAPRYHRMKTLILLGSTLGDWSEAEDCRVRAESLWQTVRRWHPEGEDAGIDSFMTELRASLDELRTVLAGEQPADYNAEEPVAQLLKQHESQVEDARAAQQDDDAAQKDYLAALEDSDRRVAAYRQQLAEGEAKMGGLKIEGKDSASVPAHASSGRSEGSLKPTFFSDRAQAPYRPPMLRTRPSFVRSEEERRDKEDKMKSASSWRTG